MYNLTDTDYKNKGDHITRHEDIFVSTHSLLAVFYTKIKYMYFSCVPLCMFCSAYNIIYFKHLDI